MKLSQKTEWIVVAVLIGYIAFMRPIPMVQDALATSVGKAVGLVGIVYVWKSVSPIVAILLAIAFVRCISMGRVWEMFSGAETTCLCEGEGYTWDAVTKKCTDKGGKEGAIKSCVCASGYAWDGGPKGTKQCVPSSGTQPPVPAPDANPIGDKLQADVKAMETAANAAPAVSTAPATSSAPMTTPGAAAAMAAGATPMPPAAGGVQPGAPSSTPAMV